MMVNIGEHGLNGEDLGRSLNDHRTKQESNVDMYGMWKTD